MTNNIMGLQERKRNDHKTTPKIVEIKILENGSMAVRYDGQDEYAPNTIEEPKLQALIVWAMMQGVS